MPTSKQVKTWEGFEPMRACAQYVREGALDEAEFWSVFEDMVKVRLLGHDDLDWLLFDHALGASRQIPLLTHYRAIARGMNIEFKGIRSFYETTVEAGHMPPWTLNRTTFYRLPDPNQRIGELLVEAGALGASTVQRSLAIKKDIQDKVGVNVAVGQIFRTVGRLSVIDFFQILGHQVGIPFVDLDTSAPDIFATAIGR